MTYKILRDEKRERQKQDYQQLVRGVFSTEQGKRLLDVLSEKYVKHSSLPIMGDYRAYGDVHTYLCFKEGQRKLVKDFMYILDLKNNS